MADTPITREEKYLAYLTGDCKADIPKPITRQERYLYELCLKGMGGEISPEEIRKAVNDYLDKNPVKPGATTEEAAQIKKNVAEINSLKEETSSLKESISTKITKFYASNQGETHLADSDDSKIIDMKLYGKSEQKQYSGKNLLNATLQVITSNGITCTTNGDGTYTLNGISTEDTAINLATNLTSIVFDTSIYLSGLPNNSPGNVCLSANFTEGADIVTSRLNTVQEIKSTNSGKLFKIYLWIGKNVTISNLVVKPMLTTDASATYDDFEPYTGGIPSPNPSYPQEIKSVVNPTVKVSNEDGTKSQTVTLPYTLNAIPVTSGGNVTIDGQQYVADYVDVERGKLVRMCKKKAVPNNVDWILQAQSANYKIGYSSKVFNDMASTKESTKKAISNLGSSSSLWSNNFCFGKSNVFWINPYANNGEFTADDINNFLTEHPMEVVYPLIAPIEEELTPEEIAALKALSTYYPVTNISVNSEQLDGYTVFNYPISMANGWNYVKKQIGDTREYIYDMDARTQDTDLQAAEAYVNSEYAVALTELEV